MRRARTLGDLRQINRADDELDRDQVGYAPAGMSDADMYTANHGC